MAATNKQLQDEVTQKHRDLKNLLSLKNEREQQSWIAEEKLRNVKNNLFHVRQQIDEVKKEESKRMEELEYNNQEIDRQQTKLN